MNYSSTKKNYQIFLFTITCICINYLGKYIAETFNLPLWLDSIGTVLVSYISGPVCGVIIGITNNVMYSFYNPIALVYSITSIGIAVGVGIFAKKKFFDTFFSTTSISVFLTFISVAISTILNIVFYNGNTGNLWGDSVIEFLLEKKYPRFLCYVAGEFYIDFADKLVTLYVLYIIIKIMRYEKCKSKFFDKIHKKIFIFFVASMLLFSVNNVDSVYAAETQKLSGNDEDITNYYNSYIQTIYNSDEGLLSGEANAIAQTNDGVLWIGTYAGLYRYNGSEMKLMDEFESVKNVNTLYVDMEGRLWIGTNDNGISICIDEKIVNVIDEESGLVSNSVRSITQSSDGDYYIGTSDSMQIVSLVGGLKLEYEIEDVNYASYQCADSNGNVVAINSAGRMFLLRDRKVIASEELDKEQFVTCSIDDDVLYVGTSLDDIYSYEISENTFVKKDTFKCEKMHCINKIDFEENAVLICSDTGIGYIDNNKKFHYINTPNFDNSIDDITVDYQGNIWLASSRLGIMRMCKSVFSDIYSICGVEPKVVNSVEKWNGLIYVATDIGLDILNEENATKVENELTSKLKDIRIRCVKKDSYNHLWICTYGSGLWEIAGNKINVYDSYSNAFGDRARVVIQLADKTIAAAGDNGISFFENGDIKKTIVYGEGLSNSVVLNLTELKDGILLAGTDGDGIAVIKDYEVIRKITRRDGLGSGVILRVVKNKFQNGFFVVTSNGLCYVDEEYNVTKLDDFPYPNCYDIYQSNNGKDFILCSAGIYVIDNEELINNQCGNCKLINKKNGLINALTVNSWNYIDENENVYLSTDKGILKFNVDNYTAKEKSYRTIMSKIKIDGNVQSVSREEVISVDRSVKIIEFIPEIINYTMNEPYIRYYLKGFENKKNVVLQSELSSIVYTNLPSGKYTFCMEVLDSTGKNVLESSEYRIEKEKKLYDNSWFAAYMLIILVVSVAWATWFVVRTQIQRTINIQRRELELANQKIEMGSQTILAIAKTVDAKDENTSHHSQRVAEYSVHIAEQLGMSEEECKKLRDIALLHDIGKIGIADNVLKKPGRLTDEEYAIMKSHVTKGAEILKDFTIVDNVWEGALYHHERYDGKGYVNGLKGEEIPLNARIIGIADAFDAMTANRVYRKKLDFGFVLEEIRKGRGTQFDPQCVDIMLKLMEDGIINVDDLYNKKDTKDEMI